MSKQLRRFYEFGPFRVDAANRLLLRQGEVVPLPPKAFDILLTLVEDSGQVLQKEELMRRVWPDSFVEEANLSNQIFTLRKALGENNGNRYIKTIPRRGYRFIAEVTEAINQPAEFVVAERSRSRVLIEEEIETTEEEEFAAEPEAPAPVRANLEAHRTAAKASPASGTAPRRKTMLLSIGLMLLLLSTAFVWYELTRSDRSGAAKGTMRIARVTSSGRVGGATISPDGKFVAYIENYPAGAGTVRVKQLATNSEVQLLPPGERVFGGTAFSMDGEFVYYTVYDKSDPKGALCRVPVLGGPATRLLGDFDSMFSFSPDGERVTFFRWDPDQKRRHLMIAALDGSTEHSLLTLDHGEAYFSGSPAWSPDGKLIVFGKTTESTRQNLSSFVSLFAADVNSGEIRQITTEQWVEIGKTNWTYDGNGLVFVALRPRVGNQVYYLTYASGQVSRVTNDLLTYGNYGMGVTADSIALASDIWESSAQIWSIDAGGDAARIERLTTGKNDGGAGLVSLADGRIVYVSRAGDDVDLWTMRDDGSEAKPLTADSYYESGLSATADGRYLVFASDRAGDSHIFRTDMDGSNLKQLTSGKRFDTAPDCSPDGRWVVYASYGDNARTLWRIPIAGGETTQLTDYESDAPTFSPDGKFISCIIPNRSQVKDDGLAIVSAEGGAPIRSFAIPFSYSYLSARWTPDGQALVYRTQDKTAGNLWKQPVAGGAREQLTNFKTDSIFNFTYSHDGKRIILSRGQSIVNVVLIRNFRQSS